MVDPQPIWQPISALPMLAEAIDGYIPASDDLYASLLEARSKGFAHHELNRLETVVQEHREAFLRAWHDHFGS